MSGLLYQLFYSSGLTNFIYQLSAGFSLVTMLPRRSIESSLMASSMRSGRHIENGTVANKGEVGGRGKD